MALNQFGAVMTFAIELENSLADFYLQASQIDNENKEEYQKRAKDAKSRKKKLEKSRRENVTEIILEPIEGLNQSDFSLDLNNFESENIKLIEKTVARFFELAHQKINVLEAKRILQRCAKQHFTYIE